VPIGATSEVQEQDTYLLPKLQTNLLTLTTGLKLQVKVTDALKLYLAVDNVKGMTVSADHRTVLEVEEESL
jgi:hypothetical protein